MFVWVISFPCTAFLVLDWIEVSEMKLALTLARDCKLLVMSLEAASKETRAHIERNDLGARTYTPAKLVDLESGKTLGFVAYNGTIWEGKPQTWTPETKQLF